MLKATSQQITDSIWGGVEDVGAQPVVIGASLNGEIQAGGTAVLNSVPPGQVFLATHFSMQALGLYGISGTQGKDFMASPSLAALGFDIESSTGTTESEVKALRFTRNQTAFQQGATPTWRSAVPSNYTLWKPKYPIAIPAGWEINNTANTLFGEWVNFSAVYGVLVSEESARTMGYAVSNSAVDADRVTGVVSSLGTASATTILAGRTGKSIRILDVHIRMQPDQEASNVLQLSQTTDNRVWCEVANSTPGEMIDQSFSPDIWLKAGEGIQIQTTVADTASVVISYEFVDADEVPGDAWWACVNPTIPTPGATAGGFQNAYREASTQIELYYPRRDADGDSTFTKTTAGTGFQHIVRGYVASAQKTASGSTSADDVDQQVFAIAGGPGSFSFGHASIVVNLLVDGFNYQVSQVFGIGYQRQNLLSVVDDINVPVADDGAMYVEAYGFAPDVSAAFTPAGSVTPTATDGDIDNWSVSMWGRTVPTKFPYVLNRANV